MQRLIATCFGAFVGGCVAFVGGSKIGASPIVTGLAIAVFSVLWGCIGFQIMRKQPGTFASKLGLIALTPLVIPVGVAVLVLFFCPLCAIFAVTAPFAFARFQAKEAGFRKRMKAKNRYISIRDASRFLEAGRGTLIEEFGLCHRVWFTEDELSKKGMTQLSDDDIIALLHGEERTSNSLLWNEYLNEDAGKAFLTGFPARWKRSGRLQWLFPYVPVVQAVRPLDRPVLRPDA